MGRAAAQTLVAPYSRQHCTWFGDAGSKAKDVCSTVYLSCMPPWVSASERAASGAGAGTSTAGAEGQAEGKLSCPQCSAKLGKFALASGVQCSCGVVVPPPAYALLKRCAPDWPGLRGGRGGDGLLSNPSISFGYS